MTKSIRVSSLLFSFLFLAFGKEALTQERQTIDIDSKIEAIAVSSVGSNTIVAYRDARHIDLWSLGGAQRRVKLNFAPTTLISEKSETYLIAGHVPIIAALGVKQVERNISGKITPRLLSKNPPETSPNQLGNSTAMHLGRGRFLSWSSSSSRMINLDFGGEREETFSKDVFLDKGVPQNVSPLAGTTKFVLASLREKPFVLLVPLADKLANSRYVLSGDMAREYDRVPRLFFKTSLHKENNSTYIVMIDYASNEIVIVRAVVTETARVFPALQLDGNKALGFEFVHSFSAGLSSQFINGSAVPYQVSVSKYNPSFVVWSQYARKISHFRIDPASGFVTRTFGEVLPANPSDLHITNDGAKVVALFSKLKKLLIINNVLAFEKSMRNDVRNGVKMLELQTFLNKNGFKVVVDGAWGGETARALDEFRVANNIPSERGDELSNGLIAEMMKQGLKVAGN